MTPIESDVVRMPTVCCVMSIGGRAKSAPRIVQVGHELSHDSRRIQLVLHADSELSHVVLRAS